MADAALEPGAGKFDPRTDYIGGPPVAGRLGKEDMPVDPIGGHYVGENFVPALPPEKRTHIELKPEDLQAAGHQPEQTRKVGMTPHTAFVRDESTNFVDLETLQANYAGRTFSLSEAEQLAIRKVLTRGVERELREERARVRASLHESGRKREEVQEDGGRVAQPVREVQGDSPGEHPEEKDVGA